MSVESPNAGDQRQRDKRELIDRNGVVLGTIWGVWSDEPCWRDVDMFYIPFRFEQTPAFDAYRPIFEAMGDIYKAAAAYHKAWITDPNRGPWRSPPMNDERRLRGQLFKSIRIRDANGPVWISPSIHIDGECGTLRVSRIPAYWDGSVWDPPRMTALDRAKWRVRRALIPWHRWRVTRQLRALRANRNRPKAD